MCVQQIRFAFHMAEDKGEQESKENAEVWMLLSHASPPHRAACCLWDHHLPPAALPWALVRAKLPLPLSGGRPRALLALGFLRAVPGRMRSPFDVSFPWIREEREGFAIRGLAAGRAPLPTGSLQALKPALFWPDPPL